MAWTGEGRSDRRDRGVAVVEYALVISLLVVAALGSARFLEDETADEVDNQATCLSTRPPPVSCQSEPLVASGGNNQASSGPGGGGGTPVSAPASIGPTVAVATAPNGPLYAITVGVDLFEDPAFTVPIEGAVMTAQITITQSSVPSKVGQFFYVDCTTDASGHCDFVFDSKFAYADQVSFDVVAAGIDTAYDFGDFTPPVLIDRP